MFHLNDTENYHASKLYFQMYKSKINWQRLDWNEKDKHKNNNLKTQITNKLFKRCFSIEITFKGASDKMSAYTESIIENNNMITENEMQMLNLSEVS